MHKRLALGLLLAMCVPLSADQNPPALFFGGHRFAVGMAKAEALNALEGCCKLSPPDTTSDFITGTDKLAGHFIIMKGEPDQGIVGTIFFAGGKVAEIVKGIDPDKFNTASADVVAFARALDRTLARDTGESAETVRVSTKHERASNADVENLSLSFSNGRTIQLKVVTLDTPLPGSKNRDSVSLDEILVRNTP